MAIHQRTPARHAAAAVVAAMTYKNLLYTLFKFSRFFFSRRADIHSAAKDSRENSNANIKIDDANSNQANREFCVLLQ